MHGCAGLEVLYSACEVRVNSLGSQALSTRMPPWLLSTLTTASSGLLLLRSRSDCLSNGDWVAASIFHS